MVAVWGLVRARVGVAWHAAVRTASTGAVVKKDLGAFTLHETAQKSDEERRNPLAVVIGWSNAKPKQLLKYLKFYHDHNIDTLSTYVGVMHVMQPSKAVADMRTLAKHLNTMAAPTQRPIIYHGFSVAAFLYGNFLLHLKGPDADKYAHLRPLIKAQVFDSPVAINGIAKGLSASMELPKPLEHMVCALINGYLTATHDTCGVNYRASQGEFIENIPNAPITMIYSETDEVARCDTIREVARQWRSRGMDVDEVGFERTPHVQHFRYHPAAYNRALLRNIRKGIPGFHVGGTAQTV